MIAAAALVVSILAALIAWSAERRARMVESRSQIDHIRVDVFKNESGWVIDVSNEGGKMARELVVVPCLRAIEDEGRSWFGEPLERDQLKPGQAITEQVRGLPGDSARAQSGWVLAHVRDSRGQHWKRVLTDEWQATSNDQGQRWHETLLQIRRRYMTFQPQRLESLWDEYRRAEGDEQRLRRELLGLIGQADDEAIDQKKAELNRALLERQQAFAAIRQDIDTMNNSLKYPGES